MQISVWYGFKLILCRFYAIFSKNGKRTTYSTSCEKILFVKVNKLVLFLKRLPKLLNWKGSLKLKITKQELNYLYVLLNKKFYNHLIALILLKTCSLFLFNFHNDIVSILKNSCFLFMMVNSSLKINSEEND